VNPAQSRGLRKAGRDIFQAVIAAIGGGGAYAVIDLLVDSVNPAVGVVLAFVFKIIVSYAQNYLETRGKIPVMLPAPGLITTTTGGTVGKVVGTVDAVATGAGEVVGQVLGNAGGLVGSVVGATPGLEDA
jgi:hypothetical protein